MPQGLRIQQGTVDLQYLKFLYFHGHYSISIITFEVVRYAVYFLAYTAFLTAILFCSEAATANARYELLKNQAFFGGTGKPTTGGCLVDAPSKPFPALIGKAV